jgi:hypothetical protein
MNSWKSLLAGALTAALLAPSLAMPAARGQDALPPITISAMGTYSTGQIDAAAAEIVAYHAATQRAYVVNGGDKTIDILDVSDPANPTLVSQIDMTQFGDAATSVDTLRTSSPWPCPPPRRPTPAPSSFSTRTAPCSAR